MVSQVISPSQMIRLADRQTIPGPRTDNLKRTLRQRENKRRFVGRLLPIWLLVVAVAGNGCADSKVHDDPPGIQTVQLGGRTFHLELAMDDRSRYQGLSDRSEIPADGGMLFVFPTAAVRQFVMRRCLVPIDLIYLDPAGRILSMHTMKIEPDDTPEYLLTRYSSPWPAQFAIELRGGSLDTLGLSVNDPIALPLQELKQRAR